MSGQKHSNKRRSELVPAAIVFVCGGMVLLAAAIFELVRWVQAYP